MAKRDLKHGDKHFSLNGNEVDGYRLVVYQFQEGIDGQGRLCSKIGSMVPYSQEFTFETLDECVAALKEAHNG